jgi:hypothetical protein
LNVNPKIMDDEEEEYEGGGRGREDNEKEEEQQPPRKITRSIRGRQKKYHYLDTVKSVEELDKLRLKVISKCR